MKNRYLAFLLATLGFVGFWVLSASSASTEASVPSDVACQTKVWTFKRDLSKPKIRSVLESFPRSEVLQLAWGEMLRPPQDSLAVPVLQYLTSTEEHSLMRGYIKSMGLMLTGGVPLSEAIEQFPNRERFKQSPLSREELCSLYKKTVIAIQEDGESQP